MALTTPQLEASPRVTARFVAPFLLAAVAMWMGFNAPGAVLIGQRLIEIDEAGKEGALAVVLGVGAGVSLVSNAACGMLSDRSRSRFGRRRPFLAAGGLVGTVGLSVLAVAPSVAAVTLGWGLVQAGLNCYLAALTAIIPDRVPTAQRATISGLFGLTQVIGTVAGIGLTNLMPTDVAKFGLLAAVLSLAALGLILSYRDRPYAGERRPLPSLAGFFSSLGHRDFALAALTRGLVTLGYALGTTYLLYFLRDRVGVADPAGSVFTANLVAAGALLITVLAGGVLSDRLRRRKVFVITSSMIIAAGLATMGVSPTWAGVLTGAALLGGGFGIYLAVDLALITEVLPSPADAGRDLGIVNIAITLPMTVAPAICALFVTRLGGYPPLFGAAALVTVVSAAVVTQIRGVR